MVHTYKDDETGLVGVFQGQLHGEAEQNEANDGVQNERHFIVRLGAHGWVRDV